MITTGAKTGSNRRWKTFSILDLTPADLSELNHGSIEMLFIRDEYKLAYNAIVENI